MSVEQVTLHTTLLGGGFGRRLEVDFILQAVEAAKASHGRAVQLLWPREEDTTHDFYRPASVAVLRATWGPHDQVQSLRIHSAGDAVMPRLMERTLPQLSSPVDTPTKPPWKAYSICLMQYRINT